MERGIHIFRGRGGVSVVEANRRLEGCQWLGSCNGLECVAIC